jgi:hypothetical protein
MKKLPAIIFCIVIILLIGCACAHHPTRYHIINRVNVPANSKFVIISKVNDVAKFSNNFKNVLKKYGYIIVQATSNDNSLEYPSLERVPLGEEMAIKDALDEAKSSNANFAVIFEYSAFYLWKRWNFNHHTNLRYFVYNLGNNEKIADGSIYIADNVESDFEKFISEMSTKSKKQLTNK